MDRLKTFGLASLMLAAFLSAPTAGRAHEGVCPDKDDCAPETRHRKAEWWPVFHHAKRLAKLDCHGLAMDAEDIRHQINIQTLGLYNRPLVAPAAPAPAAAPTSAFSAPALVPTLADPAADAPKAETPADAPKADAPKAETPAAPAPAPAAPAPSTAPAPPAAR